MSRLPLRVRLTRFFALAMAVVLAGVGAFVYVRLERSLPEQIDELHRAGTTLVVALFYDNKVAVLTGDYLFARASEVTASLGPEATRVLARAVARLTQGAADALNAAFGTTAFRAGLVIGTATVTAAGA